MNALEIFYFDLDQNGWDVKQKNNINQALQKVNEILAEAKQLEVQHFAEIDRQAFHFSKSPEKRLSFRAAGTRTMEDGSEIPFEWPDIREFKKEDFDYLYNRFQTSKNIYAKTEYGLVLFYSKNRQDNDFVIELLTALFDLLKTYIEKAKPKDDKDHYIIYSRTVLSNALYIANNRKEVAEVEAIYKALIEYTFEVHQSWNVTHSSTLRTIIDFTDFAVQYFKDFKRTVEVSKFIDKNWETAEVLSNTYVWGAIYVSDISIKLCRKLGTDMKKWLYFKAKQYEKLSTERKGDLASVSFVEKAMSIYKSLKDEKNLSRLQKEYQQLRTEFHLGEVRQEMPQDETQRIMELIKKEVKEKNEEEIVKTLLLTPMIRPLDDIKKWSEDSFKETMLQNMLPVSIQDKFGNTVAQYITDEERNKFSLLRTYEFHMQIASQTIIQYFVEAFRADKISANGIISFLNQTWMGEDVSRRSNGRDINFSYIKLIESGINSFFDELLKWKADPNYYPNFVSSTDSLVLKTEYFLREFCYFLGIATFKPNPRQQGIIMEKTLDNLLDDLEGKISDNDHFFIKFILTEKAGYNLRNRIAHGLMDNVDYGLEYPILSILIILKLSNYQFTTKKTTKMNQEISQKFQPSNSKLILGFVSGSLDDILGNYKNITKQNAPEPAKTQEIKYSHYLDIINDFSNLQANWDSYEADAISQTAIGTAIETLNHLYSKGQLSNGLTVNIFPMRDGGIQFEFDGENICAELEISQNGEMTFIQFDDDGNIENEPLKLFELAELSTLLEEAQYAI